MCCKWLCYAVFLIFREDTKCNGGFSIPVRVTTSIAHIWLNKADCELFFLLKIRLVRCLSAILKILLIHDLRFQFPLVKKSECAVHSFCHSRLCILELMRVNIQGGSRVRVPERT